MGIRLLHDVVGPGKDRRRRLLLRPGAAQRRLRDPVRGSQESCGGYYSTAGLQPTTATATAVHAAAASVSGINAQLATARQITGRVTGAGVSGLPGITVCATSVIVSTCGATKADGSYAVTVPPGAYSIQFSASPQAYGADEAWGGMFSDGYYAASGFTTRSDQASIVTVGSADVGGINAVLPRNLRITGRVTPPNGVGIAGVRVYADAQLTWSLAVAGPTDGTRSTRQPARTRSRRPVLHGRLVPVRLLRRIRVHDQRPLDREPDQRRGPGINITLPRPVWIAGRVTGAGGAGMGGILVAAGTATGYGSQILTEDDGEFAIVVAAGTYTVSYADDWYQGVSFNRSPIGYYASSRVHALGGRGDQARRRHLEPHIHQRRVACRAAHQRVRDGCEQAAAPGHPGHGHEQRLLRDRVHGQQRLIRPARAGGLLCRLLLGSCRPLHGRLLQRHRTRPRAGLGDLRLGLERRRQRDQRHAAHRHRRHLPRSRRTGSSTRASASAERLFHSRTKQTVTVATAASRLPSTAIAMAGNLTVTGQTRGGYVPSHRR